jgi:GDPmannose 4,6-dehydratase
MQKRLYLGNLNAKRDWGHARDYVRGMWLILQQDRPDDYVLATGQCYTVRQFAECAFAEVGITLGWRGEGVYEKGYDAASGQVLIEVDPRYFRPTEVENLIGDASKAHKTLGWQHETSFEEIVAEMVREDLRLVAREAQGAKKSALEEVDQSENSSDQWLRRAS